MLCHSGDLMAVTITTTLSTYISYKTIHAEIHLGKCSANNGCPRSSKIWDAMFLVSEHYFACKHIVYLHPVIRKLLLFSARDAQKAKCGGCCLLLAWTVRQCRIPLLFSPKLCSDNWLFGSSDALQLGCFKYVSCDIRYEIIFLLILPSYWQ